MTPSEPGSPELERDTAVESAPVEGDARAGLDPTIAGTSSPTSLQEAAGEGAERRLHPLSWFFVLLTQLRHAVLPLIALLILGGRDDEIFGLALAAGGAVLLAVYSVIYAIAFRYRIGANELIVREGIFDRTERHVPFVRIQNVAQRRNPLHRLFGVAELRVESAGGIEPEARMSVVTVAEAAAIERLLKERRRAAARGVAVAADEATESSERLLALPLGEIVRLGLVSNRGMVVVAALMGGLIQFRGDPREVGLLRTVWSGIERLIGDRLSGADPIDLAVSGAILLLVAFLVLRIFSVAIAILRHYGFVLELVGSRAGTEEGLLTRVRAGAALDRIQRLVIEEPPLMRLIDRRAARVDVAGGIAAVNEAPGTRFRWIAPIARPEVIDAIVARLVPSLSITGRDWRPLHPRAWRRLAVAPSLALVAIGVLGIAAAHGPLAKTAVGDWPWALIAIAWPLALVLVLLHARGWARFSAYALDDRTLLFRQGWIGRRWASIETGRLQGVIVRSTPLDRWNGMATLVVEVAGTAPMEPAIAIPFLPAAEAETLAATLRRRVRTRSDAADPQPPDGAAVAG